MPHLVVPPEAANQRLDRWLADELPDHSRSEIQRWIKEGSVLVGERRTRANHRLTSGESITFPAVQPARITELVPQALPLRILYEDEDLLVIDKPAGMVVHPAPGHTTGTVVNAILHHVPDLTGVGGEKRPGIVHRLDKDTSGVMVVAKHDRALRALQAQFKARTVDKRYIALVEGQIADDTGTIDASVGRHPVDRKRQTVFPSPDDGERARHAVTEYKVLARYHAPVANDQGVGAFTLVEAHPITGRTHQIRVHFAWRGHPLVGDPLYGLKRQRLRVERLCLHAALLCFTLPKTGEVRTFIAPLPPDFQTVIDWLQTDAR